MTCLGCGREAPPDRETGYDADDWCPACAHVEEAGQDEGAGRAADGEAA
jgi:hypothetical protein